MPTAQIEILSENQAESSHDYTTLIDAVLSHPSTPDQWQKQQNAISFHVTAGLAELFQTGKFPDYDTFYIEQCLPVIHGAEYTGIINTHSNQSDKTLAVILPTLIGFQTRRSDTEINSMTLPIAEALFSRFPGEKNPDPGIQKRREAWISTLIHTGKSWQGETLSKTVYAKT